MTALEFRLKLSSMYSIRIPYSYQCARTYPLPAPSTIKGLCANALWQKEGGQPAKIMGDIHKASLGATSRAIYPIEISSCTVRVIPIDARLKQFAFTPYIDCMIAFKQEAEELAGKIAEALSVSPVYLGDSESLVSVIPDTLRLISTAKDIEEGDYVSINSLVKFDYIKENEVSEKGVVLYMQDDPIATDAILDRCLAPLKQKGDSYYPMDTFSFLSSVKGSLFKGENIIAFFAQLQG